MSLLPFLRRAAREEIKAGADFIKIMANGGVASPTDPIHFLGFSREEVAAAGSHALKGELMKHRIGDAEE